MSSLWQDEQAHSGCSWKTCGVCSPPTKVMPSGKSSMRWPTAGSMRGGHVFEPTSQWVPAIDGIVGSVLPTPVVQQGRNETSGRQPGSKHHAGTTLQDVAYKMKHALLPTPRASDSHGAGLHGEGGMDRRTTVKLLPTPTSRDHKDTGKMDYQRQADRSILPGVIMVQRSNDGSGSSDEPPPPQ